MQKTKQVGSQNFRANLWISKDLTRSSLHFDPYLNLLYVLEGKKQVLKVLLY